MHRSPTVQRWITSQETREQIQESALAGRIPGEVFRPLLHEALADPAIQRAYAVRKKSSGQDIAARYALVSFFDKPWALGVAKLPTIDLGPDRIPSSNIINTSGLFGVRNRSDERVFLKRKQIFSRNGTTMVYTGQMLDQTDWDVLAVLVQMSKDRVGETIITSAREILKNMGLKSCCGQSYDALCESLRRMREGVLYVEYASEDKPKNSFTLGDKACASSGISFTMFNLIQEVYWQRGESVEFSLDPRIIQLYQSAGYGMVRMDLRRLLSSNSQIAKKLQCLFSGQSSRIQTHLLEKLYRLCEFGRDIRFFRRSLIQALRELAKAGIIQSAWVSKGQKSDSGEGRILVWPNDVACASDIPKEPGTFIGGRPQRCRQSMSAASSRKLPGWGCQWPVAGSGIKVVFHTLPERFSTECMR